MTKKLVAISLAACFLVPSTGFAAGPKKDPDSFVHRAAVALCTVGLIPASYCGKLKHTRKR